MTAIKPLNYNFGYHPEGLDRGNHAPLPPELTAQVENFLAFTGKLLRGERPEAVFRQVNAYPTEAEGYRDRIVHLLSMKFGFDIDGALTKNEFDTTATIGTADQEAFGLKPGPELEDMPVKARTIAFGVVALKKSFRIYEIEIPSQRPDPKGNMVPIKLRKFSISRHELEV